MWKKQSVQNLMLEKNYFSAKCYFLTRPKFMLNWRYEQCNVKFMCCIGVKMVEYEKIQTKFGKNKAYKI